MLKMEKSHPVINFTQCLTHVIPWYLTQMVHLLATVELQFDDEGPRDRPNTFA